MKRLIALIFIFLSGSAYALANPASVYCEQHGGKWKLEKRTDNRGWVGLCLFPDHTYCEEWSYFRKTCRPGKYFYPEERNK